MTQEVQELSAEVLSDYPDDGEIIEVRVGDLIVDPDLRVRGAEKPSWVSVQEYRASLRGGSTFPAIVIDKNTNRVVDGRRRHEAYMKELGEDAVIKVMAMPFESSAQAMSYAADQNSKHGDRMTKYDRVYFMQRMRELGLPVPESAKILGIPKDQAVIEYENHTAGLWGTNKTVALKSSIKHKRGQKLTKLQERTNKKISGTSPKFWMDNLNRVIEADLLDVSDDEIMKKAARLRQNLQNLGV